MTTKKIAIWMIVFFVLAFAVYAQPPFDTITSTGDAVLEMKFPQFQYVEQNEPFNLHIHVFNKTSGLTMTNDTTSCLVHLYYVNGSHLLEENLGWDSNNLEFNLYISPNNFSELGIHAYIIQCNTTRSGGFVGGSYEITESGLEYTYNNMSFFFAGSVILFLTILVIISLFLAKQMWLKTSLSLALSILVMSLVRFAGWFIEITNPNEINLIDTMAHYFMFSVWGFRIVMIAAVFILLIILLNTLKGKKKKPDNWDNWGDEE